MWGRVVPELAALNLLKESDLGVLTSFCVAWDQLMQAVTAYREQGFIELSGAPVARIVAAGGGTRIQPWMQAIADATGRPVEVSRVAEGAALGAAFLGRLAAGLESSIADAARWASTDRIVEPSADWAGPTKERYRRFLALSGSKLA